MSRRYLTLEDDWTVALTTNTPRTSPHLAGTSSSSSNSSPRRRTKLFCPRGPKWDSQGKSHARVRRVLVLTLTALSRASYQAFDQRDCAIVAIKAKSGRALLRGPRPHHRLPCGSAWSSQAHRAIPEYRAGQQVESNVSSDNEILNTAPEALLIISPSTHAALPAKPLHLRPLCHPRRPPPLSRRRRRRECDGHRSDCFSSHLLDVGSGQEDPVDGRAGQASRQLD